MNKLTKKQREFLTTVQQQSRLYLGGMDIHPTITMKLYRVLSKGEYMDEDRDWLNELRKDWKEYLKENSITTI